MLMRMHGLFSMLRAALLIVACGTFVFNLMGAWRPPADPQPEKILGEAESDRKAKRYEDALAKHVWFFENALKHQKSLYGVRLSSALTEWARLSQEYPAAKEKMISLRNDIEAKIKVTRNSEELFADYIALNKTLHEEKKNLDLFKWLDTNNVQAAWGVFALAQPDIIKAKDYKLAGKYMDPVRTFNQYVHAYRANKKLAGDSGGAVLKYAEENFEKNMATLVAVLVRNNRKIEAERVAGLALKEWDDPGFARKLESAKRGRIPTS